ncbi:oligosaccharide flippase family protein [Vibrio mediterranei]|uniref:oligosaccharide flippase family protein n=1 Tax=Vibrio mediterranei TaxID=689 RepID=UPI0040677913
MIAIISLLTGVTLARLLNAEGRGELAIIIAFASFISTIANFSISDVMAKRQSHDVNIFSISVLMTVSAVICSCFVIFLRFSGLVVEENTLELVVVYALFLTPINLYNSYLIGVLQSMRLFSQLMKMKVILPLSSAIMIASLAITYHLSIEIVLGIYAFSNTLVAISLSFFLKSRIKIYFCTSEARSVINQAKTFHIVTIVIVGATEIDKILVAGILEATSVGNYVVAATIPIALVNLILSTAQTVLLPMYEKNNFNNYFVTSSRFYFMILFPLMFVVGAMLYFIIPIIFGEQYYVAALISPLLMMSWGVSGFKRLHAKTIRGLGCERYFVIAEFIYVLLLTVSVCATSYMLFVDIYIFVLIVTLSSFSSACYCFVKLTSLLCIYDYRSFWSISSLMGDIRSLTNRSA